MSDEQKRLSVATNAAATAMFGCGTGRVELDELQTAAARTIAARVLEHVDEYDSRMRAEANVPRRPDE